ncbi:MAG: hypothetical protein KDH96_10095 [Candidatus Riesia sp.]|nr:hypothetical protein [Candidatus Riesia sp.]
MRFSCFGSADKHEIEVASEQMIIRVMKAAMLDNIMTILIAKKNQFSNELICTTT